MTTYYTNREWAQLTSQEKLSFRKVERTTRRLANGRLVPEWVATK